jgi:hypothetical protein
LVFAVTTAPRRPAPIPTRIFAFKRAGEFAPFNPIRRAAGFFTSSPRANYVGLVDHSSKLDARSIVFHEYVHFILRNARISPTRFGTTKDSRKSSALCRHMRIS